MTHINRTYLVFFPQLSFYLHPVLDFKIPHISFGYGLHLILLMRNTQKCVCDWQRGEANPTAFT